MGAAKYMGCRECVGVGGGGKVGGEVGGGKLKVKSFILWFCGFCVCVCVCGFVDLWFCGF